ncbi:hypothetical protein MT325_m596L [Paramecium bursaria chlorella virus MT325]|uniref:Uncharacterized protein m596L n=1 Tax=Paramecium bursaria Chlorella virus MT325 TaxID=346932 RepID=A7IUX6_PBCVM|nr:hypothetical protein MT325_m596L [Paramecium bursaria chlorella virus MT325]
MSPLAKPALFLVNVGLRVLPDGSVNRNVVLLPSTFVTLPGTFKRPSPGPGEGLGAGLGAGGFGVGTTGIGEQVKPSKRYPPLHTQTPLELRSYPGAHSHFPFTLV